MILLEGRILIPVVPVTRHRLLRQRLTDTRLRAMKLRSVRPMVLVPFLVGPMTVTLQSRITTLEMEVVKLAHTLLLRPSRGSSTPWTLLLSRVVLQSLSQLHRVANPLLLLGEKTTQHLPLLLGWVLRRTPAQLPGVVLVPLDPS